MLGVVYVFCVYLGGIFIYGVASTIQKHNEERVKHQRWVDYQKRQQWRLRDRDLS
jgi:hypothetical protein